MVNTWYFKYRVSPSDLYLNINISIHYNNKINYNLLTAIYYLGSCTTNFTSHICIYMYKDVKWFVTHAKFSLNAF